MPATLEDIQAWLDTLPGFPTIMRMKNGHYYVSLTIGGVTLSMVRPTFSEAAKACVENATVTSALYRSGKRAQV